MDERVAASLQLALSEGSRLLLRGPIGGDNRENVEKYIIGPSPVPRRSLSGVGIEGPLVAELISELVRIAVVSITRGDGIYALLRQRIQLVRLRNAVVVFVDPEPDGSTRDSACR